jgi:hypothetical protein
MTKQREDGGPAFPHSIDTHPHPQTVQGAGMTLRDWFAGQALANAYTHDAGSPDNVAKWAYQIADAMIEARSK